MKRQCYIGILLVGLALTMACNPKGTSLEPVGVPSHALSTIDSLMWRQPDSAFAQLLKFAETTEADRLDTFDQHYFQLLVSELLYKNYCSQSNRTELQQAVAYYDSLNSTLADNSRPVFRHCRPDPQSPSLYDLTPFLSARAHYINGVGYYENDSVVAACAEYLKALEIMEDHFEEKELVGKKAQFMALAHTHLTDLFSSLYLHEQAIYFGNLSLDYYKRFEAESWHIAWILNRIGVQYEILENLDSAYHYYNQGLKVLSNTDSLLYRDIASNLASLSYKKQHSPELSINQMHTLLDKAESDREYVSRCLAIGEIYYYEHQFDSAWLYLNKVYSQSQSVAAKKQAAEWLIEICGAFDKKDSITGFASFLIPFANQEENKSEVKSQLAELYKTFEQTNATRKHQREIRRYVKQARVIFGGLAFFLLIIVLLLHQYRRGKRHLDTQIKTERQVHQMQLAALGGRLRRSNAAMQEKAKADSKHISWSSLQQHSKAENYEEEPICQQIIAVCNDKNNPIKSTVLVSAYADIALTNAQKAELKEAALWHYGHLFEKLRQQYPELKEKDYFYCYLCLLGLDNAQISVLQQKTISTIWEREKRLKRIFGSNDKVSVILHGFMID